MTSTKSQLGQFFTTNFDYILSQMYLPFNAHIIEPFCGNGDLLTFANRYSPLQIESYDIDPKHAYVSKLDTLKTPPDYRDKFVLTNPPYLAKNKCKGDKSLFSMHKQDDLFKCFIASILGQGCKGGIIIVPLNFWSSVRKRDVELRRRFLQEFEALRVNIFGERVFHDTGYTVCAIQFRRLKPSADETTSIHFNFYPSRTRFAFKLNAANDYSIGGEIFRLPQSKKFKVDRATRKNKESRGLTNILVKCIDDSPTSQIRLSVVENDKRYIDETPKLSARSYATLVIVPPLSKEKQKELVDTFNARLRKWRSEYNSLFLTNYRESSRKRISFGLVFKIIKYILR